MAETYPAWLADATTNGPEWDLFWQRNPYGAQARLFAMDAVAAATGAAVVGSIRPDVGELEGDPDPLGGNAVVILGSGFTSATGVHFGTVAATSFIVRSDNEIHCVAPAHAAGTVDVIVNGALGGDVTLPASYTFE